MRVGRDLPVSAQFYDLATDSDKTPVSPRSVTPRGSRSVTPVRVDTVADWWHNRLEDVGMPASPADHSPGSADKALEQHILDACASSNTR